MDTDFSAWLDNGERQVPNTPRLHNLNDPIAIVGIDTIKERATFGNTNVEINADDGKIDIKNNNTDLITVCQKLITLLTNLQSALSPLSSYGYVPTNLIADTGYLKTEMMKLIEGTIT